MFNFALLHTKRDHNTKYTSSTRWSFNVIQCSQTRKVQVNRHHRYDRPVLLGYSGQSLRYGLRAVLKNVEMLETLAHDPPWRSLPRERRRGVSATPVRLSAPASCGRLQIVA